MHQGKCQGCFLSESYWLVLFLLATEIITLAMLTYNPEVRKLQGRMRGKMHFDTLPLTDTISVAHCEPEFDSGQMYQEITMPEKRCLEMTPCAGHFSGAVIGAIFDLCHLLLRKWVTTNYISFPRL